VKGILIPVCSIVFLLAFADAGAAQARKLSDAELDRVTAGGVSPPAKPAPAPPESMTPFTFSFKSPAGSRHTVEGTGSAQVVEDGAAVKNSLVIRDNAQQNLRSLINVTSVNSQIQVLVNLNITINSTVGTVQQVNAGVP